MSKRKKPAARPAETTGDGTATTEPAAPSEATPPIDASEVFALEEDGATSKAALPSDILAHAMGTARESERALLTAISVTEVEDVETTVNVSGDMLPFPGRDDLDAPTVALGTEALADVDDLLAQRKHLRGLLEALIFASDAPIKPKDLARLASAPVKQVVEVLGELTRDFSTRGIHLEEVAGGWVFRTSPEYAPFVRDLTKQRPVRLTRSQVETLAIIAYRQPVTRPEIDDVRGVDSGPVLKLLLERDLVRILGKRDEPGRPLIYGTTNAFLEFFGLKSLKDLPTLREFTELTDESREAYEEEMGEPPNHAPPLDEAEPPRATTLDPDELEGAASEDDGRDVRESMAVPAHAHDDANDGDDTDDDDADDDDADDDDDDDD
ncbi:MAG: SMC-Scp complex subunit ScpB [Labilithrix sp.]|nr:SMC-Scp complex subunit ScpB [Labilithrix sp.]